MSTENRPKPASFGFDTDFADLSKIKPSTRAPVVTKPKPKAPTNSRAVKVQAKPRVLEDREQMADKLAKSMGFESREGQQPLLKKRRRTHHNEPVDQLSIRGPVRVLNEFITYCEAENLSYWEAMEKLLKA